MVLTVPPFASLILWNFEKKKYISISAQRLITTRKWNVLQFLAQLANAELVFQCSGAIHCSILNSLENFTPLILPFVSLSKHSLNNKFTCFPVILLDSWSKRCENNDWIDSSDIDEWRQIAKIYFVAIFSEKQQKNENKISQSFYTWQHNFCMLNIY